MHFLLIYEVGPEYVERRAEFRNEHLALACEAHLRGELLLAGAVADPVETVILLFQGATPSAAQRFAAADPYVLHGLVHRWRVRPWITIVGADAATPAHAQA